MSDIEREVVGIKRDEELSGIGLEMMFGS